PIRTVDQVAIWNRRIELLQLAAISVAKTATLRATADVGAYGATRCRYAEVRRDRAEVQIGSAVDRDLREQRGECADQRVLVLERARLGVEHEQHVELRRRLDRRRDHLGSTRWWWRCVVSARREQPDDQRPPHNEHRSSV